MFSYEPETRFDVSLTGVVSKGHGVASGSAPSSPYPQGTLSMQLPIFRSRGVNLSHFHRGTLNVNIQPLRFRLVNPDVTLRQVVWTDRIPPEDFSFCACLLHVHDSAYRAVVYYPHPETKVEHFQSESMIEIIAPFVPGLSAGTSVSLSVCGTQVLIR